YGRINAHSAVADVLAGHIPPEADVTKPIWFQLLDPQRDGAFTVEGRLAAQRAAGGYTYRVQIGYGVQPTESDFIDIVPFGATRTTPLQGVLATITPADVPAPTADQIARRQNQLPDVTSDYDQFTYTIRVQVRDQPGNRLGEDRRTIFIHHDADLKAPYPLKIGGDGASSPALADLDGDGEADIVFGTSDGLVYAKHADGSDVLGWPAAGDPIPYNPGSAAYMTGAIPTPIRGAILASVAIGDIDGDGSLDIVVDTKEPYNGPINGSLSTGTSMAVAELLAASGSAHPANTRVYAIHKDGNNHPCAGCPAFTEPFLPGWPVKIAFFTAEILPDVGEGINASPALADVDGNGTLETGVFSAAGPAYLLNADGTSFYGTDGSGNYKVMQTEGGSSTSPDMPSIPSIGEGAFGDLTGAGQLSFAAPAAGIGRLLAIVLSDQQLTADDHIDAWVATTGSFQPTFPHHM